MVITSYRHIIWASVVKNKYVERFCNFTKLRLVRFQKCNCVLPKQVNGNCKKKENSHLYKKVHQRIKI